MIDQHVIPWNMIYRLIPSEYFDCTIITIEASLEDQLLSNVPYETFFSYFLVLLPGSYGTISLFGAWRKWRGYTYDSMPLLDWGQFYSVALILYESENFSTSYVALLEDSETYIFILYLREHTILISDYSFINCYFHLDNAKHVIYRLCFTILVEFVWWSHFFLSILPFCSVDNVLYISTATHAIFVSKFYFVPAVQLPTDFLSKCLIPHLFK